MSLSVPGLGVRYTIIPSKLIQLSNMDGANQARGNFLLRQPTSILDFSIPWIFPYMLLSPSALDLGKYY